MHRVLHIFPVAEIGGAENVSLNLIKYRERKDIEHHAVLLSDEEGPLGIKLSQLGVEFECIPRGRMRYPLQLLHACRSLRESIIGSSIDLVLANSPQGYLYARLATLGLTVPVLLYYMTVPKKEIWKNGILDILLLIFKPKAVFTASNKIKSIIEGWGLSPVHTVHHGTPIPTQTEDEKSIENKLSEYGIRSSDPLILFPARLQPWKGHDILLSALPSVLKTFPNAHCVFLGGSLFGQDLKYPDHLKKRISEMFLTENVHLAGQQPIYPWLKRAALVVHASTGPDPFPNVCIEALAAKRALITNTLSGTCEILTHDKDALIVEPNHPDSLASAIIKLLADKLTRARFASQGHQRYLETCTPKHMVEPVEKVMSELFKDSDKERKYA
jgi:glycosyltransferase involved in cell wall biosynthesis